MFKIIFVFISLLFVSCTATPSTDQSSSTLSVDQSSLTFGVDGGEQTFIAESSSPVIVIPGERWITCRKEKTTDDNKTVVTVVAEKNSSKEERQARISVSSGKEKVYVDVIQTATQSGNADQGTTTDMLVALSFDDGPNNTITPKMLDILEEHGVPASFFVIGQYINDSSAKQMQRAVALGCEIQNHSYTHTYMTQLSTESFKDEIERTDDLVEKYVSTRPAYFRPPYINHNTSMHAAIDHTFISGVGCQDWEANRTAQMRYDDLMAKVQDGDIILLHDFEGNVNTVEALKMIIPELKKRGFTMVTVSELFKRKGVTPKDGYIYTNILQETPYQNR